MSTNDDDGIYRVDTVPPPDGESDAYNAPTKVGQMASAIVGELVAQAEREREAAKPPTKTSAAPPKAAPTDSTAANTTKPPPPKNTEPPEAEPEPVISSIPNPLEVKAAVAAAPAPARRPPPSRNTTFVLLGLVFALAVVGIYLLRR